MYYHNKKVYSKIITAFDTVGGFWEPVARDTAKIVKIGRGGFEILYLKKAKTWKIGYGGRVGKNTYYFFIMPDGYWYNGRLYADMNKIDENGGLIPIVTTNPLMRGQYTSLEKQIDNLYGDKKGFWDKYGSWILGISFVLIAGVFLWLNYRQFADVSGNLGGAIEKLGTVIDKLNLVCGGSQADSGLVPA